MSVSTGKYEHGTLQCYHRTGCKCDPCARAKRKSRYELHLMRNAGDLSRSLVDVEPVRVHVRALMAQHMSIASVCEAAHTNTAVLHRVLNVPGSRMKGSTAQRILALEARPNLVSALASVKRMQALYALGYSQRTLLAMQGQEHVARANLTPSARARVTRKKAQRIVDLCVEIGDTLGPDSKVRLWAQRRGYKRPIDYDEDQFYNVFWDGEEVPLESEDRVGALLEDYEEICKMLPEPANQQEKDWNRAQVEERLGVSMNYIVRVKADRARAARDVA